MTSLTNSAISDRPFTEASSSGGEVADYFALLKPRVMALVIFTALVGMTVTPSHVNPVIGAISLLMIAVGAGASGCLNMWWDADVDAVMTRTRTRPIPAGRIQPGEALSFGLTLSVGSVLVLGLAANWLSAGLLAFTIVFYAVIYSMWLKRSTAQNIVIGGAAGALPPMIGQAVVTGSIGIEGTVLFLIIFIWTPPHFWALALVKAGEYARAGIPMMPNTAGPDSTRRQILAYSVLLAPLGLAPVFLGFGGMIYGVVGLIGGLAMVALSVQVLRRREGEAANKAAMSLFGFSILYLFLLFSALLAEQGLGLFRPVFG
ncbi:heme o synthase [Methylobacterium sp. 17Sr1-1]|uniref:heme o synthase n=1 Tax=Methylobacterium sp. 17Sr1-1 TaxID=2202826 RepID=UPI000D703F6B|nr:heme o synthase [Methylobacterium sp. 17Sr1-1]AWN53099.1 protoheme IX farnesyltransferase [Methylobacterium sp. 17Sr1-1]